MLNYLNNNLELIREYQCFYKDGVNIDAVIEKFRSGELITRSGPDYGRFRIFIDSCLLLLNKEKLNFYVKNRYSFKEFFDEIEHDPELQPFLQHARSSPMTADIPGSHLYFSLDRLKKTPWDEVATIRNAMAHMQYGFFLSDENGYIHYYYLTNKDKGVRKDFGIVFEAVLHKFIHCFFSNYSYGFLFKNTFFSNFSLKKRRKTWGLNYYEITCKKENLDVYNGYNSNLMKEFSHIPNRLEEILPFLAENGEKLTIRETHVREALPMGRFRRLAKRFGLDPKKGEYIYGAKAFLDFEGELSNFLVHISRLNEVLYTQCTARPANRDEAERLNTLLEQVLRELEEDERAKLAFELGFLYLQAMNFSLRTEDDDYAKLKYGDVDVSMFVYDKDAFHRYTSACGAEDCPLSKYIVERMRNALMHGHIEILLDKSSEIVFRFSDIYNKRSEKIEVTFDALRSFLSQKCLYDGVPQDTQVLLAHPARRN